MLLEIAHQESEQRNIFFVHATDAASLHRAYLHIAKCVGPEYLLKEFHGRDVQSIWSSESEEDKVRRFKIWLSNPENADALFLLDDMDGIQELEDRELAFPDEAKSILYTTRNPIFHKNDIRSRQKLRLSMMETEVCKSIISIHIQSNTANHFVMTNTDASHRTSLHSWKILEVKHRSIGAPLICTIETFYLKLSMLFEAIH
jgi:hypothetical protein